MAIGALGFTARSYGRILGANDRINVGVMGANGRCYYPIGEKSADDRAKVVVQRAFGRFISTGSPEFGTA